MSCCISSAFLKDGVKDLPVMRSRSLLCYFKQKTFYGHAAVLKEWFYTLIIGFGGGLVLSLPSRLRLNFNLAW